MIIPIEFFEEWQTLIGSALGPFFAIILSFIAFWLKTINQAARERKETFRQIEINVTKNLTDAYGLSLNLKEFNKSLEKLIEELKPGSDDTSFFLNRISAPAIKRLNGNIGILSFKTKSYYLHNKTIFVDSAITSINTQVASAKNDFKEIIKLNELLVALTKEDKQFIAQKRAYRLNLLNFSKELSNYNSQTIEKLIKEMTKIKIYNNHARKRSIFVFYWFLWKCEGLNFKYFVNKKEFNKFSNNLGSLKRIDSIIKNEVNKNIKAVRTRKN